MAHYSTLSFIRKLIQGKLVLSCDSQHPRTPSAYIHILDNDSLLKIFFLCRPPLADENEDAVEILGGKKWNDERWWYGLVQVCRRWRYLMLESASFLGLSLLCTYGTPIADMLAHLPTLPLILDYRDPYDYITAYDMLGITLALEHRDRVRRIRIMQPVHVLPKLTEALHGEFPNLEYLFIERHKLFTPSIEKSLTLVIPETFRAPRLRYLLVMGYHIPVGSPLFTTMGNLVALSLNFNVPFLYSPPNPLLRQLLFIPQPVTSGPGSVLNHYFPDDIDSQLLRRRFIRRITPYFHRFRCQGAITYLETLLPRVTVRLLERFQLYFFDQIKTHFILSRRQFWSSAEIVTLKIVRLTFLKDHLRMDAYSHDIEYRTYCFSMSQGGRDIDQQLASVTRFIHTLRAVFSPVESLVLKHDGHPVPLEWNNEAGPTQWREIFKVFGNLKSVLMDYGFVRQLSQFLLPDEGGSHTDLLLPHLQKLWYSTPEISDEEFFTEFVFARHNAGRPVRIFHAVKL